LYSLSKFHNIQFTYYTTLVVFFLSIVTDVSSQVTKMDGVNNDIPFANRSIRFSTEKIANTIVSGGGIEGQWSTGLGNFMVSQQYTGTTIVSANAASRDEQSLSFRYEIPFDTNFSFISREFVFVTRDSRDIGLSSLERYSATIGTRWQPQHNAYVSLLGGVEQNTQLGIRATGKVGIIEAGIREGILDDFSYSINFTGDFRLLDEQRTNSDMQMQFSLVSIGDTSSSHLSVQGYFRRQERGFYTFVNTEQTRQVEKRSEDRYGTSARLGFTITSTLRSFFDLQLENAGINRRYGGAVPGALQTLVNRGLSEFQFLMTASTELKLENFVQRVGISFFRRNEANSIEREFDINESDEQLLRRQETQRDNNAFRIRLFGESFWKIATYDSIKFDGNLSLLRYDTPSEANFDDRDELQMLGQVQYSHRFSDAFTFTLSSRLQFMHLVFIKQERSSLNNWNRIIALTPSFTIKSKYLTSKPRFEVLANYTVYDFEQTTSDVKSFSFRQISFRDSVLLNVSADFHAEIRLYGRHFERGRLFWNNFSETPLSRNDEYFVKMLIFRNSTPMWSVGIGARYYALIQKSLSIGGITGISSDAIQRFYGPEMQFDYVVSSGSRISLNGWYERQTVNGVAIRYVPNIFLYTTIFL